MSAIKHSRREKHSKQRTQNIQWGRRMKEHYAFGEVQIAQPGWNTVEFHHPSPRMVPRMTIPWPLPARWNRSLGQCTVKKMRGRGRPEEMGPLLRLTFMDWIVSKWRKWKIKEIKYFISHWAIHGFFCFTNIFVLQFSERFLFSRIYWLWAPFWASGFGLDNKFFFLILLSLVASIHLLYPSAHSKLVFTTSWPSHTLALSCQARIPPKHRLPIKGS